VALWLASGAAARAAPPDTLAAAEVGWEFRSLGGGLVFARATADLAAAPRRVFDVLADYERLADWVTAIDSSAVVRRDSNAVVVRQVGRTRFLLERRVRLVLRFSEAPPELLRFEIAAGDFRVYYGSWRFEPRAGGTRLVYTVTFEPPEWIPRPLLRHVLERDLRTLLPEIDREVRRRGAAPPGPAVPSRPGSRR
jgi:ribosome-associated toxin RatA of RatAB toxin-antitoxin module